MTTSLDLNPVNVGAAGHPKLIADAFQLPFAGNSFDFVLASLFLHHFTNEQVTQLLRNFHQVAREAVLINDLERHILSYCFLPITKPFFGWHRITVHDGPVSVRAAFLANELKALGNGAGIENFEVEVHRPAFRLSAVGRK
jgi:ubiquinone/menaquinone biosynthesis C-methylase UbiE